MTSHFLPLREILEIHCGSPLPRPSSPPGGCGPCPAYFPAWLWESHDFSPVQQAAVASPNDFHFRCVSCEGVYWRPGKLVSHFRKKHERDFAILHSHAILPRDYDLIKEELVYYSRLLPPAPPRRQSGSEDAPLVVPSSLSRRRTRRCTRAKSATFPPSVRRGPRLHGSQVESRVKLEPIPDSPSRGAPARSTLGIFPLDGSCVGIKLSGIGRGFAPIDPGSAEALIMARKSPGLFVPRDPSCPGPPS